MGAVREAVVLRQLGDLSEGLVQALVSLVQADATQARGVQLHPAVWQRQQPQP
ncbi:hypothetical protein QFW96_10820 [Saccharopolyspora sp. TS4A08]|uniref:Uncharacterized protein n=1 Tax=Saccharopolyspora ipomoeae TaxID=3042027 RepID=A0ABT6PMA8_9PSEU|nr:hypothetical protein [Saccharopolyspora sp. TS4A08]MDI2029105.1 hypothetical protein [Saccharopolyspora sp. TS4A08]